jgi:C_GCAxxG_C_C family probable redox protein
MKKVEEAVRLYRDGFNCPQAVLCAYAEDLGLNRAAALKIASPFGGGIARNGKICGAVTGGLMVIGLRNWDSQKEREDGKAEVYRISNEFMSEIKKRNSSLDCEELLGISVSTAEGRAEMKDNNLDVKVCQKVINDVVNLLEQLK